MIPRASPRPTENETSFSAQNSCRPGGAGLRRPESFLTRTGRASRSESYNSPLRNLLDTPSIRKRCWLFKELPRGETRDMASGHRAVREPFAEIEDAVHDLGAVVMELHHMLGKVREIGTAQIVPHGRACAPRIDVGRAAPRRDIIVVDGTEID